jgi:lipopolysaccharide transport system ATP-binding protein
MRRAEIASKFDQIVAFAEVAKFINTPVKHYSSGMYLRLAFAVAAHLEPEILVVDEVLAVGDLAFQKKCTGKMHDVAREGRTVLFVSHNMAAVRQLCSRAILLSEGQIAAIGATNDVIRKYLSSSVGRSVKDILKLKDRKGAGAGRFSSVRFESPVGADAPCIACGQSARVVLGVSSDTELVQVRISMTFYDTLDQRVTNMDSKLLAEDVRALPANGELVCDIPRVHLAPGTYRIELWLQSMGQLQDWVSNAGTVDVVDGNFFGTGRPLDEGYQLAVMDFGWEARGAAVSTSVDAMAVTQAAV